MGKVVERNVFLEFKFGHKVNEAWLENKALEIEERLEAEMDDQVWGPSVSANFERNSFEFDLIVVADKGSEMHRIIGEVVAIAEIVADIKVEDHKDAPPTSITSDVVDASDHSSRGRVPA